MTPHQASHPNSDLDPSLEALLRSSDPANLQVSPVMERSRSNTAGIPTGQYAPSFSQSSVPLSLTAKDDVFASGPNGHTTRSSTGRRWGVFLAVAASAALVVGIAVFGPWANNAAPVPLPAAPVPTRATFDPNDPQHLQFLRDAGASGPLLTGVIRAALPSDPAELRTTGWLMNVKSMLGENVGASEESRAALAHKVFDEWTWIPVDLSGLDTSRLVFAPPTGLVAAINVANIKERLITPIAGPYGVLLSDQRRLAASSVGDARSLMTLEGIPLNIEDVVVTGSPLDQFATFEMKFDFADPPKQAPIALKAQTFRSYTNTDAQSCISFNTGDREKILAFPKGSTASSSASESIPDQGSVALKPLRITSPRAAELPMDLLNFTLDTGDNPKATLKVWPTGTTGTCGDQTGEIVKFAGIKK